MLRKPAFWIVFALVSLASIGFAYRYFALAFPIVSLDISMDRTAALADARAIALRQHLGPATFRQAASFALDEQAQTFVELEGGGKDAFLRMMRDGLYSPYTWRVRQFEPGEKREVLIRFQPDGRPYGFVERLKEDEPGAALTADAARLIGEASARSVWGVDLGAFALVEQSDEKRPGGRVDHVFVYERPTARLGEGRYRLRLTVSGDRLTEVTYFIQIPEAFSRRYEEMRSANNAIGLGSSVAMVVLYVIGGIGVGLFFLLRQRWVIWRAPVLVGSVVALFQVLAALNEWPLLWMTYDTALPTTSFTLQIVAGLVAQFLGFTALFSLSFMAAESLARRAFPSHPQLWRVWTRDAAASTAVAGRTAGAYLWVGLDVAYVVALYFVTTRMLGWWSPSEALTNPDVLATYLPWLSAIAPSMQAGIWEECLFRAVPLAGAALIGDRLGNRKLWLVIGMVVQIAVFGAGHAPYPTLPSYARPVELIVPSIVFGLFFIRFGLLPGIVLHFVYDTVFFGLPIFASTTAHARIDQAIVLAAVFVPLWIVLAARLRAGRWLELSPSLRNGAWRPPAAAAETPAPAPAASAPSLAPRLARGLLAGGAIGLAVWAVARPFASPLRSLSVGREVAASVARNTLEGRGVELSKAWWVLPTVDDSRPGERFVWETAGRDRYFSLLGTYLPEPRWSVRVARFEGDVVERAEEWTVDVAGDGKVLGVSHTLPEARPGASLSEEEARARARQIVRERFGIADASLENVSADASKRPARMDWDITFKDRSAPPLPEGEPRITVTLLGDEVGGIDRFVYVPDEWQRRQRAQETVSLIVQSLGSVLLAGLVFAGAIGGVLSWSRKRFALRFFVLTLAVFLAVSLIEAVNMLPSTLSTMSTSQPWKLQVLTFAGLGLVGLAISSAVLAIVSGAAPRWPAHPAPLERSRALVLGVALGALAAGVLAAAAALRPADGPIAPSYGGADALVPALGAAVSPLGRMVAQTAVFLLLVAGADRLTRGWTRHRAVVGVVLALLGLLLGGGSPRELPAFLATGLVTGAFLLAISVYVLRVDLSLVPPAVATMIALSTLRQGLYRAYPGALLGAAVGIALTVAMAWWWFVEIRRAAPPARE